jgi:hypothetical protein
VNLKLPSWATTTLGAGAGVLAILNQTTLHAGSPFSGYITVSLVFVAGLGISPLVGAKFQSAVHLSPKVGIVVSAALAALAVALTTLNVSVGVKGLIQGVIVFFGALGFAPAVTYALGRVKGPGRYAGPHPHKLGALPAFRPPGLKYFVEYTTKLAKAPAVLKAKILGPLPIDGNAIYGDCTIAGVAHLIAVWNWLFKHKVPVPSEAVIDAEYFKLTGGQDTGLVEANVLAAWRSTGLFGEKIAGYAPIKPSDIEGIKQAIAFYGAAYLGILCPNSAQQQFANGEPWSYVGEQAVDGHCIVAVGYNAQGVECATWGRVVLVEWNFLAHYLTEAWVILSQQLVAAGKDTLGVDLPALTADLASA